MAEVDIPYKIKRFRRAKGLRIRVDGDGAVLVTAPLRLSLRMIGELVKSKLGWIDGVRKSILVLPRMSVGTGGVDEYKKNKKAALALVKMRLEHFNEHYGLPIGKLSIRNQRSRWGSCNRAGNLSFNYRIVFLSVELQDYLIVHELCHIAEHNHSPAFWRRMQETLPNAKRLRNELKKFMI